jgi:hypothetical protein
MDWDWKSLTRTIGNVTARIKLLFCTKFCGQRGLKGPLIRKGCEFSAHEILSLVRTHQISLDVRLPLIGAVGLLKGTTPSGDQIKLFSLI